MIKLGVNIDHSATLRQARYKLSDAESVVVEPDVLQIALLAERGGADSITAHLREDRRHMQDADLLVLRKNIHTKLNMEMACNASILEFAENLKPDFVCLVPENRLEITTEGGLDLRANPVEIENVVRRLSAAGARCSVFIDPEIEQIKLAVKIGAPAVELHTGAYANAWKNPSARAVELVRLKRAAEFAAERGLTVNSGHGINYRNAAELLSAFKFNELNIGHTIVARALFVGLEKAVAEMRQILAKF